MTPKSLMDGLIISIATNQASNPNAGKADNGGLGIDLKSKPKSSHHSNDCP